MKNILFIGLTLLLLVGCTGSPNVDNLLVDKVLMSEIQRAAQRNHGNNGVLPIAIDVGSLVGKNLISNASVDKIRALTKCPDLSGIEFLFAQGKITHIDVVSSKCVGEE